MAQQSTHIANSTSLPHRCFIFHLSDSQHKILVFWRLRSALILEGQEEFINPLHFSLLSRKSYSVVLKKARLNSEMQCRADRWMEE